MENMARHGATHLCIQWRNTDYTPLLICLVCGMFSIVVVTRPEYLIEASHATNSDCPIMTIAKLEYRVVASSATNPECPVVTCSRH